MGKANRYCLGGNAVWGTNILKFFHFIILILLIYLLFINYAFIWKIK